ncbi:MAG: DUF975 family protein [Firmicutes bacterium]|nr:DUF975 family protein [Bacillota bacterium]
MNASPFTININNEKVTMSNRNIKKLARYALRGNLARALFFAFDLSLITRLPTFLSLLYEAPAEGFDTTAFSLNLLSVMLTGAVGLTACSLYLTLFRQQPVGNKQYGMGIFLFGKALLLGAIQFLLQTMSAQGGLLVAIFAVILILRYTLSYFILADDNSNTAITAMAKSRFMMTGNKMKLASLIVSFALWLIVAEFATTAFQVLRYPAIIDETNAMMEAIRNASDQGQIISMGSSMMPSLAESARDPVIIIFSTICTLPIAVYFTMTMACFYELASGNMIVKDEETPQRTVRSGVYEGSLYRDVTKGGPDEKDL